MLILYFENISFGVITSCLGLVTESGPIDTFEIQSDRHKVLLYVILLVCLCCVYI